MISVALVSNFLNNHMIPLCESFLKNKSVEIFHFVAIQPQSKERAILGFREENLNNSYVIRSYDNINSLNLSYKIVEDADIAIIADAPTKYIDIRMKKNKLTFVCSERFYKKGLLRILNPITYNYIYNRILKYKYMNLYYLTIGTFAPYDLSLLNFPLCKCFQWAYFPKNILTDHVIYKKNNCINLLWAGRIEKVKHPELAIKVAEHLKKLQFNFKLSFVGDGRQKKMVQKEVIKLGLENNVEFLGILPPDKVQEEMNKNDFFLFTSDYWEGWGAVLSEAMANGCIPVASNKAGATSILIEDGINGFIADRPKEICRVIAKCVINGDMDKIKYNAINTINFKWSPDLAVNRLLTVVSNLQNGEKVTTFDSGPMSQSKLVPAKNIFYTKF